MRSQRSPPRCPRLFGQSCAHYDTTACAKRDSIFVGRSVLPLPPGALRIASLLSVWWLRHPAGVPCCGSSEPPWAWHGHLSARPAPVPLLSWLPPSKASQCNAAGLLRQGQASLRSVLRSLDTRPAALGPVAKGESQEKTAEGQPRKRPSDPVERAKPRGTSITLP